ncbi:hypothetical protein L6452_05835 [Arctium lappa]|uniref:Uncharacterized protein n=1 Tax=Arctium lappa TaxID=4217 RepID=A0ACB9EIK1_ARCLA|nr:hypothetical protein L6452_05835 [Arctium lappa]
MSLALSRFVDISMMPKNPSVYSTSQTFNPTSHTSFLKNKDLSSHSFHGSITRSLQYNMPAPWKNFVVRNNITPPEPPHPSGSPSDKVEHAMEAIEVVAKGTDEILDEITDDLPKNSKLRKTFEALDEMVEGVNETAHIANEIIDKVEELEEKLQTLNLDKTKEEAASKRAVQAKEEKVHTEETSGHKNN